MRRRTLSELQNMYKFAEMRQQRASKKMDFRASGLWHIQRLDILEVGLKEYTLEELMN